MRLALPVVALAAAAAAGCTVLPPENDPPTCDPTCCGPAPCCEPCDDPPPPWCDASCCGGPAPCCPTCPVDRSAAQLWMVRLDAGAANVAPVYETFVASATDALYHAGFDPGRVLLADLYRPERGIFFEGWPVYDDYRARWLVPGVGAAIHAEASWAGEVPGQCATFSLRSAGMQLEARLGWAPAALLVGLLDVAPRPVEYWAQGCAADGAFFGGSDPVVWAPFSAGPLERRRTRFAVLASSEALSGADERAACVAAAPTIPATALDVIAPSALGYYDPWTSELSGYSPDLGVRREVCADAKAWSSQVATMARAWGAELGMSPR